MKLPRFTLRDVFWLMLGAAIACGWWADHLRMLREQRIELNGWAFTSRQMARFIEENGHVEVRFDRRSVIVDGRELPLPRNLSPVPIK